MNNLGLTHNIDPTQLHALALQQAQIVKARTEFMTKLIDKAIPKWKQRIFKRFKSIPKLFGFKIHIEPKPLLEDDLVREEFRIMWRKKELARDEFFIKNNKLVPAARFNQQNISVSKEKGILIGNVSRGIAISNSSRDQALGQMSMQYRKSVKDLFPMSIELICGCKALFIEEKNFPDKTMLCEHGLPFVQYLEIGGS